MAPRARAVAGEVRKTLGGSVKSNAIALLGAAIAYVIVRGFEKSAK